MFHMEAGNRCWDWNVPEMINRTIVDHIADINLPYTENSRRYLLAEGIDGKTIFVTGSPMTEVLALYREKIDASDVLARLGLEKDKYILVSAHREENIDNEENFLSLMTSINSMAEKYQMPVIYSTHPRSRKFIEKRDFVFHALVQNIEPVGFLDYNKLQKNSFCVLSDSGTLSEESAILGFPAVLIRTSTERPEALDKGTIVIGGISDREIWQAVEMAVSMGAEVGDQRPEWVESRERDEFNSIPFDYLDDNVSVKVVRIIQSYTHIVNKTVWYKG